MLDEPFARGTSFLHRADPRAKLAALAVFSLAVAVAPDLRSPALALLLGAGLAAWAGLLGRNLARRLVVVNAFIVFLWLLVPFTTPGEAVWSLGPVVATVQGLRLCAAMTLKANAITLAFLALAATSDAATLGQALERLGLPAKLAFLLLFTYRFIHVLAAEQSRLATAARLRGFRPRTNAHTYRTLASLLAMVLVGAVRRAEMARRAMVLRAFDGRLATLRVFTLRRADAVFLGAMLAATCMLGALEIAHVLAHVSG